MSLTTETVSLQGFKRLQVLDGTALKIIALLCMVTDHIGDAFFPERIWMRAVGRIAMPVFAFCISEGFIHTRDRKRYLLRLLLFALISEIPFDLFASGKPFDLSQQNILFTFSWALAGLMCFERIIRRERSFLRDAAAVLVLLCFPAASVLLRFDYNVTATALVLIFSLLGKRGIWVRGFAGAAVLAVFRSRGVNAFGLLAFVPILMYNRRRGRGLKWLFYIFYPAHLLLIWLTGLML